MNRYVNSIRGDESHLQSTPYPRPICSLPTHVDFRELYLSAERKPSVPPLRALELD